MSRLGSPALVAQQATGRLVSAIPRARTWELPGVLVLVGLAVAVRRPGHLLSPSFWVDEGWVADSVRAPLEQLPLLTSSTPLGWTVLLRLVPPVGGPQYLRLLPLAFSAVAVLSAWALGRVLGRRFGRAAPAYALAAGLAVALLPAELGRQGLKQYSAEACLALVLVLAAMRLEAAWSRARLVVFACACIFAFPFANTAPFVTFALIVGLALAAAARRAWRRLAELAVAAATVALVQGAFYLRVASEGDNPAMRGYWTRHYIPTHKGFGAATGFVADRFWSTLEGFGLGPWPVVVVLLALGMAALYRAGLGGVALAAPLLAAELVVAAVLHRYPLLDQRTSLSAIALWMVVAVLGLAWFAAELARWRLVGALALVAAAAVLVPAAWRAAATPFPEEDVGGIVDHIMARRQPGETVVVSSLDAYPFAWYWPDRPGFVPTRFSTAVRFQVEYPPGAVVAARWSDAAAVDDALDRLAPGTRGVWLVVDHVSPRERARWLAGLAERGAWSIEQPRRGLIRARFPAGRP
jgi:hypothetical protein